MSMKTIATLLVCVLLTSCDKKDDEPYNPWPVWILDVHANSGLTGTPLESCIRIVWRYSDESENAISQCFSTAPNYARAWESIDEIVTIVYHVECDGFFSTEEFSVTFDPELAYTRQGHPGDEVIEDVTVSLYPN